MKNFIIFFYSVLTIIVLNILMSALAFISHTERLIINIDYFIVLIILSLGYKKIGILLFFFITFFDFIIIFSQVFPFIRITDFLYLLKFSLLASDIYKFFGLFLFVGFIVQVIFIEKIYKKEQNLYYLIVFNICLAYMACIFYFSEFSSGKFWKPKEEFIGSQISNYYYSRKKGFIQNYHTKGEAFINLKLDSASMSLFDVKNIKSSKYLLIINESWGVPHNNIQNDVLSPLVVNKNIVNFKQGHLNFSGFTISAEIRELCQKQPIHFNLKNQVSGFDNCLPNHFKRLGFNTISIHGALGLMYDRKYWYPRAGFNQTFFRDSNLVASRCYSFPGNCDYDWIPIIEKQLKRDHTFVYWLTLNTHSMYDLRDLKWDLFECEKYAIDPNSSACRNFKLQKQFFYIVSKLVNSDSLKGTQVIIVGDHEPPIVNAEINPFAAGKVPLIKFQVK